MYRHVLHILAAALTVAACESAVTDNVQTPPPASVLVDSIEIRASMNSAPVDGRYTLTLKMTNLAQTQRTIDLSICGGLVLQDKTGTVVWSERDWNRSRGVACQGNGAVYRLEAAQSIQLQTDVPVRAFTSQGLKSGTYRAVLDADFLTGPTQTFKRHSLFAGEIAF